METNVGGIDRAARLLVGTILVLAGITGHAGVTPLAVGPVPQALAAVLLLILGAVLLVTGFTQKCVINRLLGVNTAR